MTITGKFTLNTRIAAGMLACTVPLHAAQAEEVEGAVEAPVHTVTYGLDENGIALPEPPIEETVSEAPPPSATSAVVTTATVTPYGEAYLRERQANRRRIDRREIMFQILNAVDAVQTISCLEREACEEMNPLMGGNPSAESVIAVKAASGGLHYLLTRMFERHAPEAVGAFQLATISIQGGAVAWNLQFSF